jgi:hypothetical protein
MLLQAAPRCSVACACPVPAPARPPRSLPPSPRWTPPSAAGRSTPACAGPRARPGVAVAGRSDSTSRPGRQPERVKQAPQPTMPQALRSPAPWPAGRWRGSSRRQTAPAARSSEGGGAAGRGHVRAGAPWMGGLGDQGWTAGALPPASEAPQPTRRLAPMMLSPTPPALLDSCGAASAGVGGRLEESALQQRDPACKPQTRLKSSGTPTRKQKDGSLGSLKRSTSPWRCFTLQEPSRRSVAQLWDAHMRPSTSSACGRERGKAGVQPNTGRQRCSWIQSAAAVCTAHPRPHLPPGPQAPTWV